MSLINKDKPNNNAILSNNRLRKSNFEMNNLNRNIYTLNLMKERNSLNINEISDKRKHKLNTVFIRIIIILIILILKLIF